MAQPRYKKEGNWDRWGPECFGRPAGVDLETPDPVMLEVLMDFVSVGRRPVRGRRCLDEAQQSERASGGNSGIRPGGTQRGDL